MRISALSPNMGHISKKLDVSFYYMENKSKPTFIFKRLRDNTKMCFCMKMEKGGWGVKKGSTVQGN
jgi:hypothetical protein